MDYSPTCLDAFWLVIEAVKPRKCDMCRKILKPGERMYRLAGSFAPFDHNLDVAKVDKRVRQTLCASCAGKRRAFLAEALVVIGQAKLSGASG